MFQDIVYSLCYLYSLRQVSGNLTLIENVILSSHAGFSHPLIPAERVWPSIDQGTRPWYNHRRRQGKENQVLSLVLGQIHYVIGVKETSASTGYFTLFLRPNQTYISIYRLRFLRLSPLSFVLFLLSFFPLYHHIMVILSCPLCSLFLMCFTDKTTSLHLPIE